MEAPFLGERGGRHLTLEVQNTLKGVFKGGFCTTPFESLINGLEQGSYQLAQGERRLGSRGYV